MGGRRRRRLRCGRSSRNGRNAIEDRQGRARRRVRGRRKGGRRPGRRSSGCGNKPPSPPAPDKDVKTAPEPHRGVAPTRPQPHLDAEPPVVGGPVGRPQRPATPQRGRPGRRDAARRRNAGAGQGGRQAGHVHPRRTCSPRCCGSSTASGSPTPADRDCGRRAGSATMPRPGGDAHPARDRHRCPRRCGARTGPASSGPATARSTPPRSSSTPRTGSSRPAVPPTAQPSARPGRAAHGRVPPRTEASCCPPNSWTRPPQVVTSGRPARRAGRAAGTGKSTTMAAVRAAWEAALRTLAPWSVWHPPRRPRKSSPTPSGCPPRTLPSGSPSNQPGRNGANRARPLRRLLTGATPRSVTRSSSSAGSRLLSEYRRWALVRASWSSSMKRPWPPPGTSTRSRRHASRSGRESTAGRRLGTAVTRPSRRSVQAPRRRPRPDTPTLHDVRRFQHDWERDATLRPASRQRRPSPTPTSRTGGSRPARREDMLDLLFDAWRTDTAAGRHSADARRRLRRPSADLNARARDHRVATGQVSTELS